MSEPSTWTDIEHQQTDITVVLPVSEALCLKAALPQIVRLLDDAGARNAEERDRRREVHAALEALAARLRDGLRPFDVPETHTEP